MPRRQLRGPNARVAVAVAKILQCAGRCPGPCCSSFLVDDRIEDGVVRDIILASWTRSREWAIDIDGAELSAFDTESDSLLVRAARPVLDSVADELAGEPVSVILTDADGVVLERRSGPTCR